MTVTLITCCYKQREFIRVGYYVNNEHNDPAINAEIQVRVPSFPSFLSLCNLGVVFFLFCVNDWLLWMSPVALIACRFRFCACPLCCVFVAVFCLSPREASED